MAITPHHHGVDYIEIPTRDMNASKAFYASVFGWAFTDYGHDYASFDDGRLAGGLHLNPDRISDRGALVVLYSSNLEDTLALVENAGGEISQSIFSFPGGRRFQFRDPAGNELAVWSDNPPS